MNNQPSELEDKTIGELEADLRMMIIRVRAEARNNKIQPKGVYYTEFLAKLNKLLSTSQREARIDELEQLNMYYLAHDGEGEHKLAAQFDVRIAKLTDSKGV